MYKYAIIVAGGSGIRMGNNIPKQFLLLKDKPVLWYTIKAFTDAYADIEIILVLPPNHLETGAAIAKEFSGQKVNITAGGETRFQSVKNGLQFVKKESVVFVHDGVRCLVTGDLISRCYETTIKKGNAIPAIIATDTIRIETASGNEQLDRNSVRIIQTPQTFLSNVLVDAFNQEYNSSFTDEANVVEKAGVTINLVEGELNNLKITRPLDLVVAAELLSVRNNTNARDDFHKI